MKLSGNGEQRSIIVDSEDARLITRMSDLPSNRVRLVPNGTNLGLFKINFGTKISDF